MGAQSKPLWTFTCQEALELFRKAAAKHDLEWLAESLYVCRHAGASKDTLGKLCPPSWKHSVEGDGRCWTASNITRILLALRGSCTRLGRTRLWKGGAPGSLSSSVSALADFEGFV